MTLLVDLIIGSHFINITGAIYIILITLNLFKTTRIKLILILDIILTGWIVIQFIEIFLIFIKLDAFFTNLVAIYNITLILIIALFLIFINVFEGSLSLLKIALASAAVTASVVLSVLAIIKDSSILFTFIQLNEFSSFNWSEIASLAFDPFIILVGILSYYDLSKNMTYAISENHKKQLGKMRVSVVLIFFAATIIEAISIFLIMDPVYESLGIILRFVIASLSIGIGMFYMGHAYSSSKQLSLLQPQKMEYLMVINNAGLPLYDYNFRKSDLNQESILISGAIQAITILMREAFGISSNIKMIKFEDKDILVIIKKQVAFLLVTENVSIFLTNSLKKFSDVFLEKYNIKIESFNGDIAIFETATEMLLNSFGLPQN